MGDTYNQDRNGHENAVKSLTVIGLGCIGSSVVPAVAQSCHLNRITIVDRDVYEEKNLTSQNIHPEDVGQAKVVVQARRLHRINPSLEVTPIIDDVENVPLGQLRSDVILGCLDSREARRVTSQAAWRLNIPYIDAGIGVSAGGLWARVNVYSPDEESACIECGWDEAAYKSSKRICPCADQVSPSAPTNSPHSLGMLAASLQVLECQKLLAGDLEHLAVGKQVLIDAQHHTHSVTAYRRNPHCRFDHGIWDIQNIPLQPAEMTLEHVFEMAGRSLDGNGHYWLRLEDHPFVRRQQCLACGRQREGLFLYHRFSQDNQTCPDCGGQMAAMGFGMTNRLQFDSISKTRRSQSLSSIGFRAGEVFSVGNAAHKVLHYELGGAWE